MEKRYIKIEENCHPLSSVIGTNVSTTFDELINNVQQLKQIYLEHEFLYKRKVEVFFKYSQIMVKVSRLETDKELTLRIKRAENAKKASQINAEKVKEKKLAEKIKLFKKLQSQILLHDPTIVEELMNK